MHCSKCGSENHKEMDCASANPKGTFAPPVPELTDLQKFKAAEALEVEQYKRDHPEEMFEPPRWPAGPKICTKENMMAFADPKVMSDFMDKIACHGAEKKWVCEHCKQWHFTPTPKTDSNGQRRGELPKNFRPFLRASTVQMTSRRERDDELPQQKRPPVEVKKSVDKPRVPAARSSQQKRNADELF